MSEKPRVLLKLSGETLSGRGEFGISRPPLKSMANEIRSVKQIFNPHLAIVIGGGNILRGATLKTDIFGEDSAVADYMGMLATMINCICFKKILKQCGVESRVMSAIACNDICESYHYEVALSHLEKGRIVILAGGTGIPNLSTDMAMIMRAKELGMTTVLKGTKVDGVYTEDPAKNPDARFIPNIDYDDYLLLNLKIVNISAISVAKEHGIKIRVFNFFKEGNLGRILAGENVGSLIQKISITRFA